MVVLVLVREVLPEGEVSLIRSSGCCCCCCGCTRVGGIPFCNAIVILTASLSQSERWSKVVIERVKMEGEEGKEEEGEEEEEEEKEGE